MIRESDERARGGCRTGEFIARDCECITGDSRRREDGCTITVDEVRGEEREGRCSDSSCLDDIGCFAGGES